MCATSTASKQQQQQQLLTAAAAAVMRASTPHCPHTCCTYSTKGLIMRLQVPHQNAEMALRGATPSGTTQHTAGLTLNTVLPVALEELTTDSRKPCMAQKPYWGGRTGQAGRTQHTEKKVQAWQQSRGALLDGPSTHNTQCNWCSDCTSAPCLSSAAHSSLLSTAADWLTDTSIRSPRTPKPTLK
jgi:hypothetical protein